MGLRDVHCVNATKDCRTAFEIIINERVSAVPVVNDEGELVGCISNKDIFVLQQIKDHDKKTKFPDELQALEFVEAAKFVKAQKGNRPEPVTVSIDTPIHEIIKVLAEKKTHRVFIIEAPHKIVGVVSVSDIIKLILDEACFPGPWMY